MQRWMYQDDIPDDAAPAKALLVEYSGIQPEEIDYHLHSIVRAKTSKNGLL